MVIIIITFNIIVVILLYVCATKRKKYSLLISMGVAENKMTKGQDAEISLTIPVLQLTLSLYLVEAPIITILASSTAAAMASRVEPPAKYERRVEICLKRKAK